MAQIRGVEVGKILRTSSDVLEHCYPEMHKRAQAASSESNVASAPVVHEETPPPPPPVASSKSKSKKVKAEAKAEVEEPAAERVTQPDPEPAAGYEPFKEV